MQVSVIGGVAIRARRARFFVLACILFGIGALQLIALDPILGKVAGVLTMAVAIGLLLYMVGGIWPSSFLQFNPNGLTIGNRRWSALFPWEEIYWVQPMENGKLPFVCLALRNKEVLYVEPPAARIRVLKKLRGAAPYSFFDVAIPIFVYGLDLPLFVAAISRYRQDPTARFELAQRALNKEQRTQQ